MAHDDPRCWRTSDAWLTGDADVEVTALSRLPGANSCAPPRSPIRRALTPLGRGPRRGQKAFTLQTLPPVAEDFPEDKALGQGGGFSLRAGVAAGAKEREKLERPCRCISRPAPARTRLSPTSSDKVRDHFETPWRDGTTHVVFEPLDFIARLAALVPKPRVNRTRFRGVFAPDSR